MISHIETKILAQKKKLEEKVEKELNEFEEEICTAINDIREDQFIKKGEKSH